MRRLSLLTLILTLAIAGCGPKAPKAEEGVSIKDTIPEAQSNPAPAEAPLPDISHAPPGEEDIAPVSEDAPVKAAAETPEPPKEEAPTEKIVVDYPGTAYGGEIHEPAMTVAEFLEKVESLEGQVVTIEGTLGQVCQDMGCWFYLRPDGATKDNKDKIYVDLQMGAIFTIPENTEGKHAVVTGKVAKNANGYKLVGKGAVLS